VTRQLTHPFPTTLLAPSYCTHYQSTNYRKRRHFHPYKSLLNLLCIALNIVIFQPLNVVIPQGPGNLLRMPIQNSDETYLTLFFVSETELLDWVAPHLFSDKEFPQARSRPSIQHPTSNIQHTWLVPLPFFCTNTLVVFSLFPPRSVRRYKKGQSCRIPALGIHIIFNTRSEKNSRATPFRHHLGIHKSESHSSPIPSK
jgi:hypothetical protein